jgi:hypothetical protein
MSTGSFDPARTGASLLNELWKLPDEPARDLTDDVYRRLPAGLGRTDTLREASIVVKDKYLDQLHWHAVICWKDTVPPATS